VKPMRSNTGPSCRRDDKEVLDDKLMVWKTRLPRKRG
jgi:hypothetical protein